MRSLRVLGGLAALAACLFAELTPLAPCGGPARPGMGSAVVAAGASCSRLDGCGARAACLAGGSERGESLACSCCRHPSRGTAAPGAAPALIPGAPSVAPPLAVRPEPAGALAIQPGAVPAIAPPPPRG